MNIRFKRNFKDTKNKKRIRKSRPLKRAVHINEQEWRWEYSDSKYRAYFPDDEYEKSKVKILSPTNKFYYVPMYDIDTLILPSTVKQYIVNNLLEKEN